MNNRPDTRLMAVALACALMFAGAGCSKPTDAALPAGAATSVGTEIDDSVVTTRVRTALLDNVDVKSLDLKVETRKGEVQLSGYVDNQNQIDRAVAVTGAVEGVRSVQNQLALKGPVSTVGNKVDDGIVTTEVKAALLSDARVKSFDIAVLTRQGEVQLSGFVDSQAQVDAAIEVARRVKGVRTISNVMSIKK